MSARLLSPAPLAGKAGVSSARPPLPPRYMEEAATAPRRVTARGGGG